MLNISIVIPTKNRYPSINKLMCQLTKLTRQHKGGAGYCLVVVDDGSSDTTRLLHGTCAAQQVMHIKSSGPARARNLGATQQHSDYVVFLDDDCEVPVEYLANIDNATGQHPGADIIVGSIEPATKSRGSIAKYLSKTEFLSYKNISNESFDCFSSANLIVRTEYFKKTGGFNEDFLLAGGEDDFFFLTARRNKAIVAHDASLLVYHDHTTSYRGFLRRFYSYGYGHVLVCINGNIDFSHYKISKKPAIFFLFGYPLFLLRCALRFTLEYRSINPLHVLLWLTQKTMIKAGNYRALKDARLI